MNQQTAKKAFDRAEQFFKDTGNVSAAAEKSITASKEAFEKSAAIMKQSAAALVEIADTAWGSTKMLNEKLVQNVTNNIESAFTAAQTIASAKSLPEIAKLQSDCIQKFAAQATEQTKEFVDLSMRATQHLFEKVQGAAATPFKTGL